jgi:hypothetical protein
VGGGQGTFLEALLRHYPSARGVVFGATGGGRRP